MPPTIEAIRHTSAPQAWSELLGALAADGVHLRECAPDAAEAGRTDASLSFDEVDQASRVLAEAGGDAGDPVLTLADGTTWHLRRPGQGHLPRGDVSVLLLWMTPQVDAAEVTLTRLGLRPRLRSDSGGWADFEGAQGLAAAHTGTDASIVLSFEAVDVDALATRLRAAGLRADVVDESYGRSLRTDDPDGAGEIQVNETQRDLYGYQRALD